ncbi:MAG: FxSxx-COOH system tetratricopeptide repeat protein [Streptosporangiaceae bacterium]
MRALQADSAAGFNHWVGWAAIVAVPLAACALIPVFAGRIAASVTRPAGDNGQDLPPASAAPEPSGQSGDTLPLRNPTFTGRAAKLDDLERLLAAGPVAVVAVRGLGGVGKSQLALEYAHRMRQSGRYQLAGWVRADSPVTVAEDLAALAPLLGLPVDAAIGDTAAKVIGAMGSRRGWLVVFDNAQSPDELAGMLPRGAGHILITSRNRVWGGMATQVNLDEFSRPDAVKFVSKRSGRDEPEAADELAGELGDLPLALAQAAAYIDIRSMTIRRYLDSYRDPVLARRLRDAALNSAEYPASVAQTWLMSFSQLSSERPAAGDLLRLCAFLDPDDIDLDLLSTGRVAVADLPAQVLDDQERTETVGALAARNLVTVVDQGHLRVHRLVQAVTRDQLDDAQSAEWAERALRLVAAVLPVKPADYRYWPRYASLAPHIKAVTQHASSPALLTEKSDLIRKLGVYLSESEQPRAAEITFERALKMQETADHPDDREIAKDLDNLGAVRLKLGELSQARAAIEPALASFRRAYGPGSLEVARALGNLSIIQREQWELGEAQANIESALAIFQSVYGPDHPELTHTFVNLGRVQLRLGQLGDARASFERALIISETADRPDHAEAARALIGLGGIQRRQGELTSARASSERALEISMEVYRPDHPEVAAALVSLGAVQTRQGELENARANLEHALDDLQKTYGPGHPELASALVYLGAVQLERCELRDARASIARALAIREAVYGPDRHPWVATALINLSLVQLRLGELDDASAGLKRALTITMNIYRPDHPEVASALVLLGVVQLRLGKLEDSSASLKRALEISEAVYGPDNLEAARALIGLGVVQMRMRNLSDFRASLKRILAISEAAYGFDHRRAAQTVIDLGVARREGIAKSLIYTFLVLTRATRRIRRLL